MVPQPAYQRLTADERRRRLLDLGVQLFTEHAYDELSMTDIARHAGVTKAALYHYFPNKQAYFVATLQTATADVAAMVDGFPDLPPRERLERGLDMYLAWIDENRQAYTKLIRSVHAAEEVRAVVDGVRAATAERIVVAVAPDAPGALVAVAGWLWFIDGACLQWIATGGLDRAALAKVLLGALDGALSG